MFFSYFVSVDEITTSSLCRRRIKVVDVNDNRPEFTLRAQGTGGYSFSTKETVRVGETLYTSVAVKVKKILSVIFMNFKVQNLNVFVSEHLSDRCL